ncbi:MAG TPA: hypothetical protein PLL77_08645 [Pyrinomonadaceae bacterium]|nr:hypothetical protein [Pyrinomonadaceae bacterium]
MPETPKQKDKPDGPVEKDPSNWSEDQQKRGYYYDDAHGYEKYEPEKDDEIDDLDKEAD